MENVDWTGFLLPILLAVLSIVVPFVGAQIRTWVAVGTSEVNARLTETQRQTLNGLVRTAVLAAEQSGLEQGLKAAGAAKEALVLTWVQSQLDAHNIKVNAGTIEAVVKATVLDEFNRGKAAEATGQPLVEGTLAPAEQAVPTSPAT